MVWPFFSVFLQLNGTHDVTSYSLFPQVYADPLNRSLSLRLTYGEGFNESRISGCEGCFSSLPWYWSGSPGEDADVQFIFLAFNGCVR